MTEKIDQRACSSDQGDGEGEGEERAYSKFNNGYFITAQSGDDFTYPNAILVGTFVRNW